MHMSECICMYVRKCVWVCMNVYDCLELVGSINVQETEGLSIPLGSVKRFVHINSHESHNSVSLVICS